jgi:C-terminal processing protease CtpA/Prc
MLDSMRRFYYWSNEITVKPDYTLSPALFFKTLLSRSDRFSHLSGPDVPPVSNVYFTYGFHYAFLQAPGMSNYIGVVTFINKGGAADLAGLERGSYFTKVNGAAIQAQNMDAINGLLNSGSGNVVLTTATYNNGQWQEERETGISPGYMSENAVYYTRLFTQNNVRTGYLYYTSFNETYDGNLLNAFVKLRDQQVNELILDLRYNAGGSVASCAKLAALISDRLTANEVFAIYQGNQYEGRQSQTLQSVLNTSGNPAGRPFSALQARQLHLNRVFILTTKATVSAAELIINNLKPFINVIQIGDVTTGKDEASFTIRDMRNPRQVDWILQPIVYKLFNKNGQGGYAQGISPQYAVDETAQLPLGSIGSNADVLIHKGLELIYGPGFTGNPADLRDAAPGHLIRTSGRYQSSVKQAEMAAPVVINR